MSEKVKVGELVYWLEGLRLWIRHQIVCDYDLGSNILVFAQDIKNLCMTLNNLSTSSMNKHWEIIIVLREVY
jgi:hypothetical protein